MKEILHVAFSVLFKVKMKQRQKQSCVLIADSIAVGSRSSFSQSGTCFRQSDLNAEEVAKLRFEIFS